LHGFETFLVCVSNPQCDIRLADKLGQHLTLGQLALGNEADKHNSSMVRLRSRHASGAKSHRLYLGLRYIANRNGPVKQVSEDEFFLFIIPYSTNNGPTAPSKQCMQSQMQYSSEMLSK